jgi:phosphoglycolate phosphatase
MNFHAAIFDLDGTLVAGTNECHLESTLTAFREHGISLTEEEFHALNTSGKRTKEWLREKGVDNPDIVRSVRALRDEIHIALVPSRVSWVDGAEEMFERLQLKQDSIVVVTNAEKHLVAPVQKTLSLDRHVTQIITPEMRGIRPKPHPSGLQRAAQSMRLPPDKCAYVGDQLFDLKAANTVGAGAILYKGTHTQDWVMEHADHTITDIREVLDMLRTKRRNYRA